MVWNLVGEWLSLTMICIIILYSRRSHYTFSLRDQIFNLSLWVIFVSIFCTLSSTYMLYNYQNLPLWLVSGTTTLYFAVTPLIAIVYFYYTAAVLCYDQKAKAIHPLWYFCCFPYLLYLAMVLTNPWHGLIYQVTPGVGYTQGSAIAITYLVFYVYCLGCLILTIALRRRVERRVMAILLVFPVIAFIFVFLQKFFPHVILTGSASMISALILYLYLQSTRLSIDPLTGLLNRSVFLKDATAVIQANRPACAVVVSLNEFKNVNAHFGQHTGDALLRQLALFLKATLGDIPVYRTSGDRFTFMLTSTDLPRTEDLLTQIHDRFDQAWQMDMVELRTSAAIAVADIAYAEGSLDTAIRGMEYALAECKKNPEMLYCRYEPQLRAAENRREAVKAALKKALVSDGFELLYQPIWSVEDQRFTQAEALLRLKQKEIPHLYPDEFIPVAEETGLIVEMTYHILKKVCDFFQVMDARSDTLVPLDRISVNFSFLQFLQPDLKERILDILAQGNVSPSRIKIELTERILIESTDLITRFMEDISSEGIGFALDDFGVGYSNTEALLSLPFDAIKLDKGLVWTVMGNPDSEHFLRHLVHGFLALDRHVVAEGVETQEQLDYIVKCGCNLIQGYFFSKPLEENTFLDFLQASRKA
ncbi:EAL domain-containing protein [Eubacterium sp.]|uniref:EAL domain-containing protein n=1 Tax=Eubacterium sp. TaxID=142586 RepID=UPI002FC7CB90